MNTIFLLVLAVTTLDFCSTRPQNYGQSSSCLSNLGATNPKFKQIGKYANVTLTCPFSAIKYDFFKSCNPIVAKNIKISGKTLTLMRFIAIDSGMYSCQGTDANGHIQEFTWVLHIKHKKSTGSDPTSEERPENVAIMMDCRGFPGKRLFYSHKKGNSHALLQTSRLIGNTKSGIYELFDLTIDDSGYYYCGNIKQSGKHDSSHLLLKLTVRELPKVNGPAIAKVGDSVHFECSYRGPQSQTLTWYKNKKPVLNFGAAQVQLKNKIHQKSVLKLDLVNVDYSSAGEYTCGVMFDNNITYFQKPIKLDILDFVATGFTPAGDFRENLTVMVKCMTNHLSAATYSLLKKPLDKPNDPYRVVNVPGPRISYYGYGIFNISPLKVADEGYYKCRATLKGLTIEKKLVDPIWLTS